MTFLELILILNPVTTAKYSLYKSRKINWIFKEEGWYTGDTMNHSIDILDFTGNRDKENIGYLDLDGEEVTAVCVYDRVEFKKIKTLQDALPEGIPLKVVDRK